MEFNEHLKRIRKTNKSTQQELADYLNISVQSVSKWEKGTALPSISILSKIAEFYNCPINAFFSEYELQIYEQFEAMDEKDILELYEFLLIQNGIMKDERKKDTDKETSDDHHDYDTIPFESMFLPGLYEYLKNNNHFSFLELQNYLGIGYVLALQIFDALKKMGILVKEDKTMTIVKEKIDLLLPYINKNITHHMKMKV